LRGASCESDSAQAKSSRKVIANAVKRPDHHERRARPQCKTTVLAGLRGCKRQQQMERPQEAVKQQCETGEAEATGVSVGSRGDSQKSNKEAKSIVLSTLQRLMSAVREKA
jgi:hypothetical protein